jgi:hypothetical protein
MRGLWVAANLREERGWGWGRGQIDESVSKAQAAGGRADTPFIAYNANANYPDSLAMRRLFRR